MALKRYKIGTANEHWALIFYKTNAEKGHQFDAVMAPGNTKSSPLEAQDRKGNVAGQLDVLYTFKTIPDSETAMKYIKDNVKPGDRSPPGFNCVDHVKEAVVGLQGQGLIDEDPLQRFNSIATDAEIQRVRITTASTFKDQGDCPQLVEETDEDSDDK